MSVHEDLKSSVKSLRSATKAAPCHFVFLAKGSDGAMVINRKKVAAKEIADAKKEIGAASTITGTCYMEGGALILETAGNPPASLEKGVKAVLSKHAGLTLQVTGRAAAAKNADDEDESDEEQSQQSEQQEVPNAPPVPHVQQGHSQSNANESNQVKAEKEKIAAMVKAIQPRLQAAMREEGGNAAKGLFDKAAGYFHANEFEEAEEELEQLDATLKRMGK